MVIQRIKDENPLSTICTWKIQFSNEFNFIGDINLFEVKAEFMKYISEKFDEAVDDCFLV